MATWSDITIEAARLKGFEPADFINPETDTIREELVTDELTDAAKSTFTEKALSHLFNLSNDLGGEDVLFDTVAGTASLSERLHTALTFAYLHHFYRGELISTEHVNAEKAEYYWMRFESAIMTFSSMAVNQIESTSSVTTSTSKSVQVRSSVNWFTI